MAFTPSDWNKFLQYVPTVTDPKGVLASTIKQSFPLELSDNVVILACENDIVKKYFDKKVPEIERLLAMFGKKNVSVSFQIAQKKKKKTKGNEAPLLGYQPPFEDVTLRAGLHSRYSFENFAVSTTNQVAYAAAQAVADNPGHSYNPLFLWGGVGVGKTHLAQAVARHILEKDPEKKVFFCPGDLFTNELIEAIRGRATAALRKKYRYLKIFVVDDVQFIAGKEAVQEEFFHTFNSIVSAGGQVILTSDRPPHEIKDLENRLRSRFSGGLIVDIQSPDFELRTAILLNKAKEKNIEIDIEAAKILAEQIEDTRALEGTLLSVYAKMLGRKERIDLEALEEYFQNKPRPTSRKILPNDVLRAICSYYNIRQTHLKGPRRDENIVLPRQIAMFILRVELKINFEDVAYALRRKDHTTVMYAVDKIRSLIAKDPSVKKDVDTIMQMITTYT